MTESLPSRLRASLGSQPILLAEAADALDVAAYSRGEFDRTILSFEETIRVLTAENERLLYKLGIWDKTFPGPVIQCDFCRGPMGASGEDVTHEDRCPISLTRAALETK